MNILNFICFCSMSLFSAVIFAISLVLFVTSFYACFSKKVEGKLFTKIMLVILFLCMSPWALKLTIFFIQKAGGTL